MLLATLLRLLQDRCLWVFFFDYYGKVMNSNSRDDALPSACFDILHTIASVGPKSFGLGPVALNLVREQRRLGYHSRIWSLDSENHRRWAAETNCLPESIIRSFPKSWPYTIGYSMPMEKMVSSEEARTISIVHQHGIWTGISRVTRKFRLTLDVPSIIAPHGSLEKWALKRSKFKKKIALALYERQNLQMASCLHACSHQEISGFRDFGLSNPIAVIPNGIGDSWLESQGDSLAFRRQFHIPESKRILLFLSRITPIKGLPMLMDALGSIRKYLNDWVVVLAGADEFNHLQTVQQAVLDFGLENTVVFTGMLRGQLKRDAFAAADLFILPTQRENFAIVVAEALGAGVPVITTKGAPWQDLVSHDCGWWTDISAEMLAVALQDAIVKPPEELKAMGERGRALVSSRYTWKQSAQMTIELYEWLLGRRERPAFVVMD